MLSVSIVIVVRDNKALVVSQTPLMQLRTFP
jgi:hypothetical protein